MIKKIGCLMLMSLCYNYSFAQEDITSRIISRLEKINSYDGKALFRVTLPMTDEEVEYQLTLRYQKNTADTLYPYSYLIDIASETNPAINGNFIYYNSGNYYNFNNQRLREYHAEDNLVPFQSGTSGQNMPGIQRSGLFIEELPMEIADRLRKYKNNPENRIKAYADTLIDNHKSNALHIDEYLNGEIIRTAFYVFDSNLETPLYKEVENNPGHLGSQTVTVKYIDSDINIPYPENYFSEERLIEQKGNILAPFRSNHFRAKSLVGKKVPAFSLPLTSGEKRFDPSDDKGRSLVLAFVDTTSAFSKKALACAELLSHERNLTWVTLLAEQASDDLTQYEQREKLPGIVISNARSIAARYGITDYPTLFVVSPEKIIKSVQIGYDPDLLQNLQQALKDNFSK